MERWEPPPIPEHDRPRARPRVPAPPRRDLPEIWLMVGLRLAVSLVFTLAAVFDPLRGQMPLVVLVMMASIAAIIVQSNQQKSRKLRNLAALDLVLLLTIVPIAVLNAFVAAEPGELLPAEQSALLQTWLVLLVLVAVVVLVALRLFPEDRMLAAAGLLPALVAMVSVSFVLHDYRNQTVIAMLAVSYFVGAAVIALGSFVEEPVGRYLATVFYLSTVFAGGVLFDPGLGNLFDREALVQVLSWLMILIGLVMLILVVNPIPDPRILRMSPQQPPEVKGHDRDSSRNAANRG